MLLRQIDIRASRDNVNLAAGPAKKIDGHVQKTLLMLGGSAAQVAGIRYARQRGYHVVLCDYLPDNPGRQLADEYYGASTTDLDAVLQLARKLRIDGIVAYGSDPAAVTAAYVGNALGLPSNPYQSVVTLARKDLFRAFLADNGFNTPRFRTFTTPAEAAAKAAGLDWPVVVKPVDSSGSKGVSIVRDRQDLPAACETALSFARFKAGIVEEYVQTDSPLQLEGDGFVCDGCLVFRAFCDGNFDPLGSPVVPIGVTFPSIYGKEIQDRAHADIQRLLSLLRIERGALNFDIRVDRQGRIFLIEIGPRNGGNLLPQVIQRATGVDLNDYIFRSALDLDCSDLTMAPIVGYHGSYVLHTNRDGIFRGVAFSDAIEPHIRAREIWATPGQPVRRFDGSHQTLGLLMLEFESFAQMRDAMLHMEQHVAVLLG